MAQEIPPKPATKGICIYFLRGNCRAKECKFRHDLQNIQCRSNCKQKSCKFKHYYEIKEPSNKVNKWKQPPKTIFLDHEPVAVQLQKDIKKNLPKIVPVTNQTSTTAILKPMGKENDKFSQLYDLSCRELIPYSLPLPTLTCPLKVHQLQGLTWLLQKESEHHGGILADEMGLGKTFLMIALVNVSNKGNNLIVCPVSLIKPWIAEIRSKSNNSVIEYSSKLSNNVLEQYRFIIISYEMLSSTYTKRPSFYDINFERVILDEADKIRNYKTKMANACYSLTSTFRWAVTGTPINNSPLDLYSLVKFLRIKPMMDLAYFQKHLGMESSAKIINLQSLVRSIVLRRTKELVIDLPPITFETRFLEMTGFERSIYDLVVSKADNARLIRLKQCCNDVYSIDGVFQKGQIDKLLAEYEDKLNANDDDLEDLFSGLKVGSTASKVNDEDDLLRGFSKLRLQPPKTIGKSLKPVNTVSAREFHSTKISELLQICKEKVASGEKVVIFSQFVKMLTRLSTVLTKSSISSTLFTGEMSQSLRTSAINSFSKNTSCLLASIKCAAVGLNLTMASTVVMFDQWYNPALEDQAFARVYRIGQTKPVNVIRLVMKNTVEGVIMSINERKRKCIEIAVGAADEKDEDMEIENYIQDYYLKLKV